MITKSKIKKGDTVLVIAGKYKGKRGTVLVVDKAKSRLIVEGVNMVKKHQKARSQTQQAGIIEREAPIHASNVMYIHKGKPTRIGFVAEKKEVEGKVVTIKRRVAKSTGEIID